MGLKGRTIQTVWAQFFKFIYDLTRLTKQKRNPVVSDWADNPGMIIVSLFVRKNHQQTKTTTDAFLRTSEKTRSSTNADANRRVQMFVYVFERYCIPLLGQ